jgi:hypothetical protein
LCCNLLVHSDISSVNPGDAENYSERGRTRFGTGPGEPAHGRELSVITLHVSPITTEHREDPLTVRGRLLKVCGLWQSIVRSNL